MNSEEKRLLEDILFQLHVITTLMYGNLECSEFVTEGMKNEMQWIKEFIETREGESAKQ